MTMRMDRRTFLATAATIAAADHTTAMARRVLAARPGSRPPTRTRLILLGTAGGPRPQKRRAPPAQVIVIGDAAYVVDCGDGVARQLVLADVPLTALRHAFITHQHSDHTAGYGNLLLLAWESGLASRVDTWGPPPLDRMTRLYLEMNAPDIETRIADEGRVPLAPLIHTHELRQGGSVMQDENVRVTAVVVEHPPVRPAFAYRFDSGDRSIVISGDTRRSEALAELAHGADILVHEALYVPGVERIAVPNAADLRRSILSHHTAVEDVGRLAQQAGVKTLVLSHLVPPGDPSISDAMWADAARAHFSGDVIVGRDLLEV
jgi:ribonuclease BN (tRNA processing enzyme)